ncbi:methyltransferase family protein [Kribbella voronezhensis]|uniref:Methyltransferase family protein n=1 Tax=Kribbella voronezhensis TaxID=2512212 RepID=A0A4R7T584_9ACTN|nr:class I SAM-dependent methyltransferase [Kribbella voronezhensis]TDU86805.1 methyltransferase family protein [Kribbella voronezhensis]
MVDYDDRLHRVYAAGRALEPSSLDAWMGALAAEVPAARPLSVLDLGSGIGRFTPALADTFGGPVYGVEPSARMREIATTTASHPNVTYLDGSAEAIPLPDASCDLALLFLSFHHFSDKVRALREVARVLRPGGVVLLRSQFSDRMPELHWYRYFPSARRVDAAMYLSLEEVRALAAEAGLVPAAEPRWVQAETPGTLRASYERVKHRAYSTFEHLPPDEIESGFSAFEQAAAADPDRELPPVPAALLVLNRP